MSRDKRMAIPVEFYLSARELALLNEGPLSSSDSERLLAYLERDEQDPVIEAWLSNPVGPPPPKLIADGWKS